MNLAQATYDGVAIGGDEEDGIDFFIASTFTITDEGFFRVGLAGTLHADKQVNVDTLYHYAGILSGTDLGAPVEPTDPTATWNGSFRTHNTNPVDFQLTVTFGTTDGTRTISAFVKDNARWGAVDNYYLLAGTYTDAGVITGTVNWGTFSDIAQRTPTSNRPTNGVLTGLIGAEGAVAVFTSNTPSSRTIGTGEDPPIDNTQNIITGKVFNNVPPVYGYVGGFVASASLRVTERVTYRDWAESFDDPTTGGVVETPSLRAEVTGEDLETGDDTFSNQFLAIHEGETALDEAGITTTATTRRLSIDLTSIGRTVDGIGGFAALANDDLSYAGILPNTNLGKPLTSGGVSATWRGGFHAVGGYQIDRIGTDTSVTGPFGRPADFELDITFGGVSGMVGSIKGSFEISPSGVNLARANVYFLIEGNFNASGVITGTTNFGKFEVDGAGNISTSRATNGVLTGLIGEHGAVGAFISNPVSDNEPSTGDRNFVYAGGFAVAPQEEETITPEVPLSYTYGTDMATYSDWVDSFTSGDNAGQTLNDSGVTTDSNFNLGGHYIKLDGSDDIVINTNTTLATEIFRLNETNGEDGYESGFAYGINNGGFEAEAYAGLLSSTDVGGVITSATTKATWSGRLKGLAFEDQWSQQSSNV